MRYLQKCIVFLILFKGIYAFGQLNIQTGYDLGSFTVPLTNQRNFNKLHRINFTSEYIVKSNISFSFNGGIDLVRIKYEYQNRLTNPSGNSSRENFYSSIINLQNFSLGLSIGYEVDINSTSRIHFKFSYDQYLVNHFSVLESYRIENWYDVPVNEIGNNDPVISKKYFDERLDLERIGYKNRLLKENRNIIFLLEYRHHFDNIFISPSFGFSPWNHGFILSKRQNLFLFGINFGYTLPQKNKTNEK